MTGSAKAPTAMAATKPAHASTGPIPFRPEGQGAGGSALDVLLVLVVLLGACVAALWIARKKGWLDRWVVAPLRSDQGGMKLEQTLRISQRSALHRVRDGDDQYLILESAGVAQFVKRTPAPGRDADG